VKKLVTIVLMVFLLITFSGCTKDTSNEFVFMEEITYAETTSIWSFNEGDCALKVESDDGYSHEFYCVSSSNQNGKNNTYRFNNDIRVYYDEDKGLWVKRNG